VIFKRVNCINEILHRVSLTSLLYVFKRLRHVGGSSCPTLGDGLLASLLLESQRRLEVREIFLDFVAAAETAAAAVAAAAASVGGSATRHHTQAREGQGQEAQARSAHGIFVGPALRLDGRRARSRFSR
jgi:hypothetical protein